MHFTAMPFRVLLMPPPTPSPPSKKILLTFNCADTITTVNIQNFSN